MPKSEHMIDWSLAAAEISNAYTRMAEENERLKIELAAALAACEAKDAILRGIELYRAYNGDDWPSREAITALVTKPDASALKAHDEALIERCAVAAWNHYAEVCKNQGVNPHHYGEWIASAAIRKLKEKP